MKPILFKIPIIAVSLLLFVTASAAWSASSNNCSLTANQLWAQVVGTKANPNPTANLCVKNCLSSNPTTGDSQLHCLNVQCSYGLTLLSNGQYGTTNTYELFMNSYNNQAKACASAATSATPPTAQQLRRSSAYQSCLVPCFRNLSGFLANWASINYQDTNFVSCINACSVSAGSKSSTPAQIESQANSNTSVYAPAMCSASYPGPNCTAATTTATTCSGYNAATYASRPCCTIEDVTAAVANPASAMAFCAN